jgi:hypothetical protein
MASTKTIAETLMYLSGRRQIAKKIKNMVITNAVPTMHCIFGQDSVYFSKWESMKTK